MPRNADQLFQQIQRLDDARVTAPRMTPGTRSYSAPGAIPGVVTDTTTIGVKGGPGKRFNFRSRKPGVPRAQDSDLDPVPLPELEEVVVSAGLSWWQRLNNWLRFPADPDKRKKVSKLLDYTLDFYARTYMPGVGAGGGRPRFPLRLSSAGPRSLQRQRGFVAPMPTTLPPLELPPSVRPPSRRVTTPSTAPPRGQPTLLPLPILRPTPPPGYEYDPDERPDLIAPAQPVPLPNRTPAAAPNVRPVPSPSRVPSPVPGPRPLPSPVVIPTPQRTPTPRANPTANPVPFVTPVPVPRTAPTRAPAAAPRDYLLLRPAGIYQQLGLRAPSRASTGMQRNPTPTPSARAMPQPLPFPDKDNTRTPPGTDACECEKEKKKPKKRKEPRVICYSGTFRERSKSLTKIKRKVIPCQ